MAATRVAVPGDPGQGFGGWIAVNGKTCAGVRRLGGADTHLLAACGHRDGPVLGQLAVLDHAVT
jgi:hypothetical protein